MAQMNQAPRPKPDPQAPKSPVFDAAFETGIVTMFDGLGFPASRAAIYKTAQENGAGNHILDRINNLPDQIYDSVEDIMAALFDEDADTESIGRDANKEPAHMSSQAADPGEFKASSLESRRPTIDGRDD